MFCDSLFSKKWNLWQRDPRVIRKLNDKACGTLQAYCLPVYLTRRPDTARFLVALFAVLLFGVSHLVGCLKFLLEAIAFKDVSTRNQMKLRWLAVLMRSRSKGVKMSQSKRPPTQNPKQNNYHPPFHPCQYLVPHLDLQKVFCPSQFAKPNLTNSKVCPCAHSCQDLILYAYLTS